MKTEKIKRYRLGVSRTFPTTHPRAGQQTWFVEKINEEGMPISDKPIVGKKIHTIRANYPLWEKRMKAVQEGKAVIELFYWEGKPYKSLQLVFATLDKGSGCGVQKLIFGYNNDLIEEVENPIILKLEEHTFLNLDVIQLSANDGLLLEDFKSWFKKYDLSKPMAIIHFTKFRY